MFVLVNGSFGVGKTTVAVTLRREIARAAIFDPESVGFVLRRLPAWMLGRAVQPDDYQDLAEWRYLVHWGIRLRHLTASHVIVPMAFTNREYLDQLVQFLGGPATVRKVCLVAPLDTVRSRLEERARREGTEVTPWAIRRSKECVEAHVDPSFGFPIDATKTPADVASDIRTFLAI